ITSHTNPVSTLRASTMQSVPITRYTLPSPPRAISPWTGVSLVCRLTSVVTACSPHENESNTWMNSVELPESSRSHYDVVRPIPYRPELLLVAPKPQEQRRALEERDLALGPGLPQ